jgi:hypothetical protein
MWSFREELGRVDVSGFSVEAVGGRVGKVDQATLEPAASYLVVDSGPAIFGKNVLLPAALVSAIDRDDETVYVDCTKHEIRNAPDFDRDQDSKSTKRGLNCSLLRLRPRNCICGLAGREIDRIRPHADRQRRHPSRAAGQRLPRRLAALRFC